MLLTYYANLMDKKTVNRSSFRLNIPMRHSAGLQLHNSAPSFRSPPGNANSAMFSHLVAYIKQGTSLIIVHSVV